MMKQLTAYVLFLITSQLLTGCGGSEQPTPAGGGSPPAPAVTVISVQPESVSVTAELPGRTTPYLVAELRPQVTGLIKERLFKEGSDVRAGQTLYQIDPAAYQSAHDSARANLARAEANLEFAKIKAGRYAELVKTEALSVQLNDEAQAEVKQAEADVAAAKAGLDKSRIDLDHTRVSAPITGRIGRSAVTAGALVIANQPAALATVQQLDPIYVDMTQSSVEMLRLKSRLDSGKLQRATANTVPVQLVLEDGSLYVREGRLAFSEVTVDQTTGSVTLRAVFPNPDAALLPGMYVRARLLQGTNHNAFLLPHAAVSRNPRGQAQVMIVNAEDKAEARTVKAEQSLGDRWVVTDGLTGGDRVIVEGLQRVRPGAAVQAQEAGAQTAAPAPSAAAK